MAENVVCFLLDNLSAQLVDVFWLLSGVRAEVQYIVDELERIKGFLRVADAMEDNDIQLKVWVKQVRDVAYDIEDSLDEFNFCFSHYYHGCGFHPLLPKLIYFVKNLGARCRIGLEIQVFKSRVEIISNGYRRYHIGRSGSSSGGLFRGRLASQGDALLLEEVDLVRISEPKRQLIEWLTRNDSGRQVVSVVGMGGLGKTTLVKQVYEDPRVKKRYKVHTWITVSRSFKTKNLLKDVINQIFRVIRKPVPPEVSTMNNDLLKESIKDLLKQRRYLIVLDDVWQLKAWDSIKLALPRNDKYGSRFVITTHNAEIASASCVKINDWVYNFEPLGENESWDLFCMKAFYFHGGLCPPHLEETCRLILKKCGGLPLAIVAIGAVLGAKDMAKTMRLIRLWIAEGFVVEKEGKTLEEVAEGYFKELLDRGLVQVAETTNDGRIKSCHVHDLLREIAILKSKDQDFAEIAKEQDSIWLLKVLDLRGASLESFPKEIVKLIHLRYLSLRNTKVNHIPSSIKKLQNLETLDLKQTYVIELPVEILSLKQLRHLLAYRYEIESCAHFDSKYGVKVPLGIGSLQSLQKLCFIEANQGNGTLMIDLGKMKQLRRLGIVKFRERDGIALCSSIEKLTKLRSLSITSEQKENVYDGDNLHFKEGGFPKLKLLGLDKLDRLQSVTMDNGVMPKLEKLVIQRCKLLKNVPTGIEHLSNLKAIEFFDVPDELVMKLRPDVGIDYEKIAHVPAVYSSYWIDGGWDVYSIERFSERESSQPGTAAAAAERMRDQRSIVWKV
ncbi:hypothetical protein CsatA_010253 [Cannabis sativa]